MFAPHPATTHSRPHEARGTRLELLAVLRRSSGLFLLSLALVAGAACSGDAQEPAASLVESSDPELRRMAGRVLPGLAERAGLELREPVRVERRTREELIAYLRYKLDEDLPPEEAALTVEAYAMLGLVEPDLDLRGLLLSLYTEQVAGFYEPDSTALFVMDDQPPEAMESLLLHELVHAVQDQTVDLEAITSDENGNDGAAAAHSAIEGHATLVMLEFMMEGMTGQRVDLATMPSLADQLMPALDGMSAQFPALAGAPPIIQRTILFPYAQGAGFVQRLWASEGRVAPFGAFLPASTEQVMEGSLDDPPVRVEVEVDGGTVVHEDILGRLETEVFLDAHVGMAAPDLARGWGGDRFVLVEAGADGERTLAWASVWDDEDARDAFVTRLAPALASGLGRPATVTPLSVDGRPGALLLVGSADGLTFRPRVAG